MSTETSYKELSDQDPYGFFEEVRELGPAIWDEQMHGWLLTGYDDCAHVQRNEDLFRVEYPNFPGVERVQGPRGILLLTGEQHSKIHHFYGMFFSPSRIKAYRETMIRLIVESQIGRIAAGDRADLAEDLAERIPARVIAGLVGLPFADEELMDLCKACNDQIGRWNETYGEVPEIRERAMAAAERLGELIVPHIEARRDDPRDDLLSGLWTVGREMFDDWDIEDMIGECRLLLLAGSETTAGLLTGLLYLLMTREGLRDELDSDRARAVSGFVEEGLRLFAPAQHRLRIAVEDVDLAGVTIKKGQRVYTLSAAANRDPHQFEAPEEVRPTRPGVTRHLSFNQGIRRCIGAPLARAEGAELVEAVLDGRLPSFRADPEAEPPRRSGFLFRTMRPLHVVFGQQRASDASERGAR